MGTINYYVQLCPLRQVVQQPRLSEPEEVFKGRPVVNDAKLITLAEYDVDTKDAITAHHLKDYRRKTSNLVFLPNVNILFDRILEGSEYWNELLHHESTYGI